MELLLTKSPIVGDIRAKSVGDYFKSCVERATQFNIATGFISNDSVAALKQILEFRQGGMGLNMLIGMNYLDGFTKPQYRAVEELNKYLMDYHLGQIYVSPSALYHGKMYSFQHNAACIGSFVGSSNLASFVGTDNNHIESDIMLKDSDGEAVNKRIISLIDCLGKPISDVSITNFKQMDGHVLDGYSYVTEVPREQINSLISERTGESVVVPLKTEAKSNLNTYFGAGKIKGKYSPRGWYEVELIVSKTLEHVQLLPDKDAGPFDVVTVDGYRFTCERQGDYSKNLRSCKDLKILGRWIKGQMENDGALDIGTPVTKDTLRKFGRSNIVFEKTTSGTWLLSLK